MGAQLLLQHSQGTLSIPPHVECAADGVLHVQGMEAYGVRAFAEALEVIPSTLAENAGLDPINIVTQLRNRHAQGDSAAGINVRKVPAWSFARRNCHKLCRTQ